MKMHKAERLPFSTLLITMEDEIGGLVDVATYAVKVDIEDDEVEKYLVNVLACLLVQCLAKPPTLVYDQFTM